MIAECGPAGQDLEAIGAELASMRAFGNAHAEAIAYITAYVMARTRGEAV